MVIWLFIALSIFLIPIHSHAAEEFDRDCSMLMKGECEALTAFIQTIKDDYQNCIHENWEHVMVEAGSVVEIQLGECNFKGSLVPELGNLTSLTKLVLYGNDLNGSNIPSELGKLKNLEVMLMSSCNLIGLIPEELGKLKQLNSLSLASNHLSGSVPQELVDNLSGISAVNMTYNDGGLTGRCTATPCYYGAPV